MSMLSLSRTKAQSDLRKIEIVSSPGKTETV